MTLNVKRIRALTNYYYVKEIKNSIIKDDSKAIYLHIYISMNLDDNAKRKIGFK